MEEAADAQRRVLPWLQSSVLSMGQLVVLNAYPRSWFLAESRGRWKSTLVSMSVSTKPAR